MFFRSRFILLPIWFIVFLMLSLSLFADRNREWLALGEQTLYAPNSMADYCNWDCTGSTPDSLDVALGIRVSCTQHELQKVGSMGRQIVVDENASFVNFTSLWGTAPGTYQGLAPVYSSWRSAWNGMLACQEWNIPWVCDESYFCYGVDQVSMALREDSAVVYSWAQSYWPEFYVTNNDSSGWGSTPGYYWGMDLECEIGFFGSDSMWAPYYLGDATGFAWPHVAYTPDSLGGVTHHLLSSNRTDGPVTALYFQCADYENLHEILELGPAGQERSFVMTASRRSPKVAIAFSGGRGDGSELGAPISRYNGLESGRNDNDLYLIRSEDAGFTWGPMVNITKRANDQPGGFAPHAKISLNYDEEDNLHVVWQAVAWDGYDQPMSKRGRMYHWDESSADIHLAVEGNWAPTDCDASYNQLTVDNPQISAADGKLYLTFSQFAPLPLGRDDDCGARALTGDGGGAANADLFVSVSSDGGVSWDAPRFLLDTYTPNCDTIQGTENPDCYSEVWHSTTRFGVELPVGGYDNYTDITNTLDETFSGTEYLFTQYVSDRDPGVALKDEGGWTANKIRTFRFGAVEPQPIAQLGSSLPQGVVADEIVHFSDTAFAIEWVLEHFGSGVIPDLSVTLANVSTPGCVTVSGFGTALSGGASDPGVILVQPSVLEYGLTGSVDFVVDGSFYGAPKTFSFTYQDTTATCCETAGDANFDGTVTIGDVVCMVTGIFADGLCSPPFSPCADVLDVNNSSGFNIGDVVYMVDYIFNGGSAPECGAVGLMSD